MHRSTLLQCLRGALVAPCCCALALALAVPVAATAATMQGTAYEVDVSVVGGSGGASTAGSTTLDATAGEAFVGATSSGAAAARSGYLPQLPPSIGLVLDATAVNFGAQVPGTSAAAQTVASVTTDSGGYQLLASQDHDLLHADGVTTVPPRGAALAAPQTWTDGVTVGFGIGVSSGTNVDAKWRSGADPTFADLTTSPQVLHAPSVPNGTDVTTIGYRVGLPAGQKPGTYSNTVVFSVVAQP